MPTTKARKIDTKDCGWTRAIRDAKARIKGLEETIDYYRRQRKAGQLWPGDEKAGTAKEAIPA